MWPTAQTPWLLFLGLIPLAYLGWFVVRYGKSEITSLQFIVVTLIWIGYHLSPTLAYFEGRPWDSFLLSSAYIDQALLFSVLNMFAILIGYRLVMRKTDIAMRNSIASRWILPRVKWSWILWLSLLTLIIVIYVKGGFSDFWDASYSRGSRQWAERTLLVRIERALNVMIAPLSLVLIVFSSIHIFIQ